MRYDTMDQYADEALKLLLTYNDDYANIETGGDHNNYKIRETK